MRDEAFLPSATVLIRIFLEKFCLLALLQKILNNKKDIKHKYWAASLINLRPDSGICHAAFKVTLPLSLVTNISLSKLRFIK